MCFFCMKVWTLFNKVNYVSIVEDSFRPKGNDDRNPLCSKSKLLRTAVVYHGVSSNTHRQWYFQIVEISAPKKQRTSVSIMVCTSTVTKEMSTDHISSAVRSLSGREYLSKMEDYKLSLRGQLTKRWWCASMSYWQSRHNGRVVTLRFQACCKAAVGM